MHMQSVPIITNAVSSNPAHGEVYSIQYYVIKWTSCATLGGRVLFIYLINHIVWFWSTLWFYFTSDFVSYDWQKQNGRHHKVF
jgi:hypothetical protein